MLKRMMKKLNNRGSSFVMIVVTMTFLSVLAASVLIAVGFSYRLKVYNLNSKNNFYYVEQALDEINAGVGNIAIKNLQKAYADTVEVLVYYDISSAFPGYVTMKDKDANKLMKKTFIQYMKDEESLNISNLATTLESYVTNPDITLMLGNAQLDVTNTDAVIIRNVTVKREAKYKTGNNNGTYIQSITTDIVVSEPGYNVSFHNANDDNSALYDFAMVADKGIEITGATSQVNISGNVYAAADFYNKDYNSYSGADTDVSSYADGESRLTGCNGLDEKSMYSGLYVNGSRLTLQSDTLIVPGTLGIFNGASFILSAKKDGSVVASDAWIDNIVLGGYTPVAGASSANLFAEAYVYDDLELNADDASLKMQGSYYGYNYSQSVDDRSFVDAAKSNYQDKNGKNNKKHYNSSSIILNGQNTTLDFEYLNNLYIAGRSYIEMSKIVSKNETTLIDDQVVETKTYTYDKTIDDYLTGESLSVKSNQLAYMPLKNWKVIEEDNKYYVRIPATVQEPYEGFFQTLSRVPIIKQTVSGNDFYFLDFNPEVSDGKPIYEGVDKEKFIVEYVKFMEKTPTQQYSNPAAASLKDITDYQEFQVNAITLPKDGNIYSTGAITVRDAVTFNIVTNKRSAAALVKEVDGKETTRDFMTATKEMSDDYRALKYMLTTQLTSDDKAEVDKAYTDYTHVSPIMKYFNVSAISNIENSNKATLASGYTLGSGYRIWVSEGDVSISDEPDGDGKIQGIVVAKGDVTFDTSVLSFEGLIVSGSKIYVGKTMNFIANAEVVKAALRECNGIEDSITKNVIACFKDYGKTKTGEESGGMAGTPEPDDPDAEGDSIEGAESLVKDLAEIDYKDLVAFVNWKKNVE